MDRFIKSPRILQDMTVARMRAAVKENPNMMIAWFLMCVYAFNEKSIFLLPEDEFEKLVPRIGSMWDDLTHPHKAFIDKDLLGDMVWPWATYYTFDNSDGKDVVVIPKKTAGAADLMMQGYV